MLHDIGGIPFHDVDHAGGEDLVCLAAGGGAILQGDSAEHPVLLGGDRLKHDLYTPPGGQHRAEGREHCISRLGPHVRHSGKQEVVPQVSVHSGELLHGPALDVAKFAGCLRVGKVHM